MVAVLNEFLQLTRVVSNAGAMEPGQPLSIEIIPPLGSASSSIPGLGDLQRVLRVQFLVERELQNGKWQRVNVPQVPPKPDDLGNLLSVAFSLVPSVTFGPAPAPQRYRVRVGLFIIQGESSGTASLGKTAEEVAKDLLSGTIEKVGGSYEKVDEKGAITKLGGETISAGREIVLGPFEVPPIKLPTVAIISTGPWMEPITDKKNNAYVILIEPGSVIDNLAQLFDAYNAVLNLIDSLKDILKFCPALLALQGPLKFITKLLTQMPIPPGVVVGSVGDFNDFVGTDRFTGDGFDDENISMIMLGSTRSKLMLCDLVGGADVFANDWWVDLSPLDLVDVLIPSRHKEGTHEFAYVKYVRESFRRCAGTALPDLEAEYKSFPVPVKDLAPDALGFGLLCIGDWNQEDPGVYGLNKETMHWVKQKWYFFRYKEKRVNKEIESAYWGIA